MIVFGSGDIFATPADAYAHGVNCAGAMGAGIALEFKRQFREMYEDYRMWCEDGVLKLGHIFVWDADEVIVYNLATQAHYRTKATLPAVQSALEAMVEDAEELGLKRVALPRIGAGLGGLPWEQVKAVMRQVLAESEILFLVAEEFEAGKPVG